MCMKSPVATGQVVLRQTEDAAQLCKIFLQVLHEQYAIHSNLSIDTYPVHLGTPAVDSLANPRTPLSRLETKWICKHHLQPFLKGSSVSAIVLYAKSGAARRTFFLLVNVI